MWASTPDVREHSIPHKRSLLIYAVVPSNMNPVGAAGNIFSSLFDKVPAKRAGASEDITGAVIYLVSKAGVSWALHCSECVFDLLEIVICRWHFALRRWGSYSVGERTGVITYMPRIIPAGTECQYYFTARPYTAVRVALLSREIRTADNGYTSVSPLGRRSESGPPLLTKVHLLALHRQYFATRGRSMII